MLRRVEVCTSGVYLHDLSESIHQCKVVNAVTNSFGSARYIFRSWLSDYTRCLFVRVTKSLGWSFSLLLSSLYPSHTFPWPHRNLKYALELVNVVADSRYKLYEDFVNEEGRRLGEYLGAVRQAVLYGLEGGGSDPFRVISSE